MIFTPKSQAELATQESRETSLPQISFLSQHDASRAPLCPGGLDPFPGVDSDGSVFGTQRWGGATSSPVWKREEFAASGLPN